MLRLLISAFAATVVIACASGPQVDRDRSAESAAVETPSEPLKLIEQLGAESIADREAAQAQLLSMGPAASPLLVQALSHGNPEVVVRAKAALKELNRKPVRGFPAVELNFHEMFAARVGERHNVYLILGSGFFAAPNAKGMQEAIERWIDLHSRARAVAVSAFEAGGLADPEKKGRWIYAWIEDDTENLNLHLVEQGFVPGCTLESALSEILVSTSEYQGFLARARLAQKRARKAQAGIWSPDFPLSTTLMDPWQVKASACLFEEEYAEAILELREGLAEGGSASTIWAAIADCHDKLGDYPSTLEAYDKSLEEHVSERAILGRAQAVSRKEGPKKADRWLRDLEEKRPSRPELLHLRGLFHMREGRYRMAIEALSKRLDDLLRDEGISFDDGGILKVETVNGNERWKDYSPLDPLLGELAKCHLLNGDMRGAVRFATMGITAGQARERNQSDLNPKELEVGDVACRLVRAHAWLASKRVADAKADVVAAKAVARKLEEWEEVLSVEALIRDLESKSAVK